MKEGDKHYVLARNVQTGEEMHYKTHLPIEIPSSETGTRHGIPFYVADDIEGAKGRMRQIQLRINIRDLVSADRLTVLLNGRSLENETCLRDYGSTISPYSGQWLEFHLRDVLPRKGGNLLEISLDGRPDGLVSPLRIEQVELFVEYGAYPSALNYVVPAKT